MQLILISGARAKTRSITMGPLKCFIGFVALLLGILLTSIVLYYVTLSTGLLHYVPFLENAAFTHHAEEFRRDQQRARENIDAMAVRVGDLQAKLLEIDMMGRRLGEVVGVDSAQQEQRSHRPEPQGGPLVMRDSLVREEGLASMIEDLTQQINERAEYLLYLENHLTSESVRMQLFPGQIPIEAVYLTSNFGARRDPFSGRTAYHEGVDFAAPIGTDILAAAGGVIRYADYHPQYGYQVDIDHGDGLLTRYAHCSRLFVRAGEVVKRGSKIAAVGNTGRSTGPHLHFEVREKGVAVNPLRFLRGNS